MRLLRIGTLLLLVLCLTVNVWVTARYNATHNTEKPTISCQTDSLELSVKDPREALLQGLTAQDAQDGDLTGKILVASESYFIKKGVLDVEYVVFDSHQNSDTLTRRVCYTDYESPKFSLGAPLVFTRGQNIRFLEYITATDLLDGDISEDITVLASELSNYTVGTYPVLLQVSNSYGDTVQLELMVVVRDATPPDATIYLSEYVTYVQAGESFDPYSLVKAVIRQDGTYLSKDSLQILGSVDTQTPGFYHLLYRHEATGAQVYLTVAVTQEVA